MSTSEDLWRITNVVSVATLEHVVDMYVSKLPCHRVAMDVRIWYETNKRSRVCLTCKGGRSNSKR